MLQAKTIVTVPARNEARFIQETLTALASQSYEDFKVLIADNASDDGTSKICKSFANEDDRFVYWRHDRNMGAASNFEYCLKQTDSEYFMWCGAHDIVSNNFLERTVNLLDQNIDASIAFGDRIWIDTESMDMVTRIIDRRNDYIYEFSRRPCVRYLQSLCRLRECTIVNGLLRREHMDGVVFYPVKGGDHIILSRILWRGGVMYDFEAQYKRRHFEYRRESQEERIAGGSEIRCGDYEGLVDSYAGDARLLVELGFPNNRLIHFLIRRIVTGRFIGGTDRYLYKFVSAVLRGTY